MSESRTPTPTPSDTGVGPAESPTDQSTIAATAAVKAALDALEAAHLFRYDEVTLRARRAELASAIGLLAGQTSGERAYIVRELRAKR